MASLIGRERGTKDHLIALEIPSLNHSRIQSNKALIIGMLGMALKSLQLRPYLLLYNHQWMTRGVTKEFRRVTII